MDLVQANAILDQVAFPGYTFKVKGKFEPGQATYLQAVFFAPDNDQPGIAHPQHTRKWLLSAHMTRSELVQTAFKCVLTSIEHEAREQFTYQGHRIFGPHFNVDMLAVVCSMHKPETRKEPA